MKIVLIAGTIFPQQSPRAFRATELAVGLAKQGHEVTIYAILGEYINGNSKRPIKPNSKRPFFSQNT